MQLCPIKRISFLFPGAKSKQLNPYLKPTHKNDRVIVHVAINDILRCKNESELEELPTNIIEIGKTCQKIQDK